MAAPARDLASTELWQYSLDRSRRRRAVARRRRSIRRMSMPLALVAATTAVNGPAFAAGAKLREGTKVRTADLRILRRGAVGPDVLALQRALGVRADGVFGPRTERVVRGFQERHGLLVDGEVGPRTRAALARGPERPAAVPGDGILERGDRGAAVARLQRALGVAADGVFGPVTDRAVRAFQARHGLLVDGEVGPQTRAALAGRSGAAGASGGGGGGGASAPAPAPAASSAGARAAALARGQLGAPYSWGGAGPAGFDCSGLVMWAYAQVGVSLPHNAAAQYGVGRSVSRSQLAPGDLVFFDGLGHVGVYLGGGRFVHAPNSSRPVSVDSLGGWYADTYVGARRVG
jgi:cell wall-associated NlpC family hydrolase